MCDYTQCFFSYYKLLDGSSICVNYGAFDS